MTLAGSPFPTGCWPSSSEEEKHHGEVVPGGPAIHQAAQKQRPEYEWPYSQPVAGWSSHGFRTHPCPDSTAAPAPNSPGSRVQSTARSASRAARRRLEPSQAEERAGARERGQDWRQGVKGPSMPRAEGAEAAVLRRNLALSPPEPGP
nr:unnamed protein product [Rangifer tarandus platyrhynchus]